MVDTDASLPHDRTPDSGRDDTTSTVIWLLLITLGLGGWLGGGLVAGHVSDTASGIGLSLGMFLLGGILGYTACLLGKRRAR